MDPPPKKINLISCGPMAHVSDIKLIRTDTTLDLSQKAEKGMPCITNELVFYSYFGRRNAWPYTMWDKLELKVL